MPNSDQTADIETLRDLRREVSKTLDFLADRDRSQPLWDLLAGRSQVPNRKFAAQVLANIRNDLLSLELHVPAARGLVQTQRGRCRSW